MKVVIFAGGVGTRLWPLSRKNTPKQFEKIVGEKSTLQQTVSHLIPEFSPQDIFIATGTSYEDLVRKQLPELPNENFIFEPTVRDVGPAIGLTSIILEKRFPDEPVAILWSDHMIKNIAEFKHCLFLAKKMIEEKEANFVYIAQKSRFANQNMGWIEVDKKISESEGVVLYSFKRLIYRPGLEQAQDFFANPNYVWNLGYFVTTPRYLVNLYKQYTQDMYQKLLEIQNSIDSPEFSEKLTSVYHGFEKISFDDAILVKMKSDKVRVLAADLGWSDIGAWESLKEALAENLEDNVTRGSVLVKDSRDSLVFNYTNQLVVGIDLDELLVINTNDVTLVCPKRSVPKIKKLVESLSGTEHEKLT